MTKAEIELLKKAQSVINSFKLSMWLHPDCIEDSEFYDMALTAQDMEDEIERFLETLTLK